MFALSLSLLLDANRIIVTHDTLHYFTDITISLNCCITMGSIVVSTA